MSRTEEPELPRLTSLAHGGGCGCKVAPGLLESILSQATRGLVPPDLLVGPETRDDAAVWRLDEERAIVATTDFFMPIVDDPFDFGRIAATNALSDVWAMGGRPLFALAIVGMPVAKLPVETIGRILAGGEAACRAVNVPIAGGHTIDSAEPIYGLVAIGLVDPRRMKRNLGARPGDALVLGKPLGTGILAAALRQGRLETAEYAAMIASTTRPNAIGAELAREDAVHAMTDVTGFGLLGHLLEMCRGAGVGARLDFGSLPLLPGALEHARAGRVTGASARNESSFAGSVEFDERLGPPERSLLSDPQTSGGLLVACDPGAVAGVVASFRGDGFLEARVVGEVLAGRPRVTVRGV